MKKSVVLTSILFSSLALGSEIVTPETIYAVEDVNLINDEKITNYIEYVDIDDTKNFVKRREISGLLNSKFDLGKLEIPNGYELLDKSADIIISAENSEHIVYLKAKQIVNTINLMDSRTKKIVKTFNITGLTGHSYDIFDRLPKNYKFVPYWNREHQMSGDEGTHNIEIYRIIEHYNIIRFLDPNNELIEERKVLGEEGDRFNLLEYLPDEYAFEENQVLNCHVGENKKVIEITVHRISGSDPDIDSNNNSSSKHKVKNTFKFYDIYGDTSKIISSIDIEGEEMTQIIFEANQLPKGYEAVYHGIPVITEYNPVSKQGVRKILNGKAKFVDLDNKFIASVNLVGGENTTTRITAPDGYTFLNDAGDFKFEIKNPEKTYILVKQDSTNKPDKNKLTTKVTFIDKDTKKQITQTQVSGNEGTKQIVKIPSGYKLATGFSNIINMEKNTGFVTIQLIKVDGSISVTNPGSNNSNVGSNLHQQGKVEAYSAKVSTHFSSIAPLHDIKGREVRNRALMANSNWYADKRMTLNGKTYYRVATNEWVSSENVYEYTSNKTIINTATGSYKQLYNSKGQLNKTRALASNTSWVTDKTAMINGVKMFRVATDEWVAASDIR